MSKFSSQPIISSKQGDEPALLPFYSQATFDDPFRYTQDLDEYLKYQNENLNRVPDVSPKKVSKRSKKTTKKKENGKNKKIDDGLSSYIIQKIKKGKRIIKISISNLELDSESKEVSVQYIVEDNYDEMLSAAEGLVDKIIKRLSNIKNYYC